MIRANYPALLFLIALTAAAQTDAPRTVSVADAASHIARRVEPTVTPLVKATKLGGKVKLHIVISPSGDVSSATVESGHPLLVKAALDAVKQWKFKPFLEGDTPIAVATDVELDFPGDFPAVRDRQVHVVRHYKYGYIDKTGKMVIPLMYDDAHKFSEGLAAVWVSVDCPDLKVGCHLYGYIDKSGQMVLPLQYSGADNFSEGLARVEIGWKSGYIDKAGKMVIPLTYDAASDFSEGLAAVWVIGQRYGYIDKTGKMVLPPQYDKAERFAEGVAHVEIGGEWGYIDKTGKKAIPPQYHANWPEGLDAHFQDGKWGYINETGKMIIPPLYAAAHKFSEGLAAVWVVGGRYGYIDKTGKMVIPPQYVMADNFSEGLAAVESDDK
jgi:TonB family protein